MNLKPNLIVPIMAGVLLVAGGLAAQEKEDEPGPWWTWEYATGDWGGIRDDLVASGITFEVVYTGEVFTNTRGGKNTSNATEYLGNLDVTLDLDTERMGFWQGGRIFVLFQNLHGEGITEDHVGDVQVLSNYDADDFTQISEVWLEQLLFGEALRLKIGKQESNEDFLAPEYGGDFINSSFGYPPNVLLTTYPDPGLGLAGFVRGAEWFSLGAGVYDGDAKGGQTGFNTAFDGEGGFFSITEAAFHQSFLADGRYPGTYRMGGWYHSENIKEISGDPNPKAHDGDYGLYLVADQRLIKEGGEKKEGQGLGTFFQYSWAPGDRNEIGQHFGWGLAYTGLVAGRDEDVTGIGMARVVFGRRSRDQDDKTHETTLEFFHKFQIAPWFFLQPDLQWIVNPGGGDRHNALALGTRFEIRF